MRKIMHRVSLFLHIWNKHQTVISMEEFINRIRNGYWKVPVEGYRRCLNEGRKQDADNIKAPMPCITPAGTCHGGHAQKNLITLSCLLCVDLDHTNERTKDIFIRACLLEYVLGAFISISGSGVKLLICIDIEEANEYPAIYKATAALVAAVLDFPHDPSCADITHTCFGSYDPDAYYQPDAKPVNSFLPALPLPPHVAGITYAPSTIRMPAATFVQSYLTLYPAVKNERNATLFRLGCEACKRNIDPEELTSEAILKMEEPDFREAEIRRTVKSAYQHIAHEKEAGGGSKLSSNTQTAYRGISTEINEEIEEANITGEDLREQTPTFPDEIFNWIPSIFSECILNTQDKRERDGLLLSSITTVSSMLPTVTTYYNRRRYRPNLYSIIIAPSGNSKGIFAYGLHLHKHYCAYWEKLNKQAEKEYKKAKQSYELACQQARRSKAAIDPTNMPQEPEEPHLQFPLLPPDISKAKLIQHLINNVPCSSLLASTEASSVCTARGQDYGQFDDVFCKAFEHETVNSSYIVNGQRPLQAENPSLSTFFTGTPSQLVLYTPSTENGLFNRQLPYTYSQPCVWQDVFAEEETPMNELFDLLSRRFCRMALFLKDSPTEVKFTDEQKKMFNERFTKLLAETNLLGNDDLLSVVKRHGVMAVRLCMIFTAVDKATLEMDTPVIFCSDKYFKASLAIVGCCLEHSKLLVSSLKSSTEEMKPLQAANRMQQFFTRLPQEFSTEMAISAGDKMEVPSSTVYKWLSKSVKNKIIKRLTHGMYIQTPL